jgi:hypothetical protein
VSEGRVMVGEALEGPEGQESEGHGLEGDVSEGRASEGDVSVGRASEGRASASDWWALDGGQVPVPEGHRVSEWDAVEAVMKEIYKTQLRTVVETNIYLHCINREPVPTNTISGTTRTSRRIIQRIFSLYHR